MVNVIVMVHSTNNKLLYSSLFGRMDDINFLMVPYEGKKEVAAYVPAILQWLQDNHLDEENIDYILVSSNYGMPASEEVNYQIFNYFLQNYPNAQIIGMGNTTSSLFKALDLNERISIMGTSLSIEERQYFNKRIDTSSVSRVYSISDLKNLFAVTKQKKGRHVRLKPFA